MFLKQSQITNYMTEKNGWLAYFKMNGVRIVFLTWVRGFVSIFNSFEYGPV